MGFQIRREMVVAGDEAYRLRSLVVAEYVTVEDRALVAESYSFRNLGDNFLVGLIDHLLHLFRNYVKAVGNAFRHSGRGGRVFWHGVNSSAEKEPRSPGCPRA